MSDAIDIAIGSTFDSRGFDQAIDALKRLGAAGATPATLPNLQDAAAQAAKLAQEQAKLAAALARSDAAASKAGVSAAQLAAAQARADAAANRTSASAAQLATAQANAATAQTRASVSAAQLTTATANAATAQTRSATAAQTLAAATQRVATEEQRTAQATANAAAAQARAELAALKLAKAQDTTGASNQTMVANLTSGAASAVTALTGIGSAMAAVSTAYGLAQAGAQAQLVAQRFDGLARSAGTTGNALMGAMRAASGGEINDLNLQLAANRAQMLGVAKSADEFSVLMQIARDRAQALGTDTGTAFNDLVTGLGRGSAEILDNLGIMINAQEVTDRYAQSLGKTSEALSAAERKQAIINAVLAQGRATIAATGGAVASTAGDIQVFQAGLANARDALGGMIATSVGPWLEKLGQGLNFVAQSLQDLQTVPAQTEEVVGRALQGANSFAEYEQRMEGVHSALQRIGADVPDLTSAQYALAKSFTDAGMGAQEAYQKAQSMGEFEAALTQAGGTLSAQNTQLGDSFMALMPQMLAIASSSAGYQEAVRSLGDSLLSGSMDIAQFGAQLTVMAQQQQTAALYASDDARMLLEHGAAATGAAGATQIYNTALTEGLQKTQQKTAADQAAQQQTQLLANAQSILSGLSGAVRGGLISAADAASYLANRYNIAKEEARQLIAMQMKLGHVSATPTANVQIDARKAGISTARVSGADAAQELALMQQNQRRAVAQHRQDMKDAAAAEIEYQKVLGNYKPAIAEAEAGLAQLRAAGKAGTADYINQQAKLASLQQQAASAAKRGGKGARESAAAKAGAKIESIEENTGQKLADIDRATQEKLVAIDQRAAEKRAATARALANEIRTSMADMVADQEIDDLDAVAVKDADTRAKIAAREAAEAKARAASVAAVEEAQRNAAEKGGEYAKEVYAARQEQIKRQQELDERYAERQRELSGNPKALAELQKQYDEATAAIAEAANQRVTIAQIAADQEAQAVADEKARVVADAEDQKVQVLTKAQQQADGVKASSADARAAVVSNAQAARDGAVAAAEDMRDRVNAAYSGIKPPSVGGGGTTPTSSSTPKGGSVAAAGGAHFTTSGPTALIVGDNPGGRERVSVTPISGRGQTRVTGGAIRLAGGGSVETNPVDDAAAAAKKLAAQGTTPNVNAPSGKGAKGGGGGGGGSSSEDLKAQLDEQKNTVELLQGLIDLRSKLEEAARQQPFNVGLVTNLLRKAREFTEIVRGQLVPLTEDQGDQFKRYVDAAGGAISIISDMVDLRGKLSEAANQQPFDVNLVRGLIRRAQEFTQMVQARLVPLTEFEADQIGRYADAVGSVMDFLGNVADLRGKLSEATDQQPFDPALIQSLADDAQAALRITQARLVPITEEEADQVGRYTDAAGGALDLLGNVADLRETMTTVGAPLDMAVLDRLATEGQAALQILQARMVPTTQEQADAAQTYADAVGAALDALKGTLDLSGALFTDYTSPTDAQLDMLAADAARITARIAAAAQTYSTEGLAAAKTYSEVVGQTFSAFSDGLKVIDQINQTDLAIDPARLDLFRTSTDQLLGVMTDLSARAATIPSANIAAFQAVTGAVGAYADAAVKLAAVPFADMPALAGAFGNAGSGMVGGLSNVTIINNITAAPGMSAEQVAELASTMTMRKLNARVQSRS